MRSEDTGKVADMKPLDLKSFYLHSLGISSYREVTDDIYDGEHRVVTVFVGCASGVAWADPETGERAEIKDWQERSWCHLATCQFQPIVAARVPRLLLGIRKPIAASVPWAQRSARETRTLESHAIDAVFSCRTVRAASGLTGLGEDHLDGIMARLVRDGLARCATSAPTLLGIDEPERSRDRLPQATRRVSAVNHRTVRKGHCYASFPTELNGGGVMDMVEGCTTEAATALLEVLPPSSRTGAKAVAMDMSVHVAAAQAVLPRRGYRIRCVQFGHPPQQGSRHRAVSAAFPPVPLSRRYPQGNEVSEVQYVSNPEEAAGAAVPSVAVARSADDQSKGPQGELPADLELPECGASDAVCARLDQSRGTRRALSDDQGSGNREAPSAGNLEPCGAPDHQCGDGGGNSMIQSLTHSARGLPCHASLRTQVQFHPGKLQLVPS